MLEPWGYEIFNSVDSGTLVRLAILLGLMICVVWGTFRTELKKPPVMSRPAKWLGENFLRMGAGAVSFHVRSQEKRTFHR
jgi:hypothetical protein